MRFVLTGYSGMMGDAIRENLLEHGEMCVPGDVPIWTDPITGAQEPDFATPDFAAWLRDVRPDVVIHAGAVVGSHRAATIGARLTNRSNITGQLSVARAARDVGAFLVTFASESEYDPDGYDLERPISVRALRYGPRSLYGASKLAGHLAVKAMYSPDRLLVLHPSFGYGGPFDAMTCCGAILRGVAGHPDYQHLSLQLDPSCMKGMTWHDDVARLTVALALRRIPGEYPAAAKDPLSLGAFLDMAQRTADRSIHVEWNPDLDYKRHMRFDPAEIMAAWHAADLRPTFVATAIREEIQRNRALLTSGAPFRRHVWSGMEALADAAGPVRT